MALPLFAASLTELEAVGLPAAAARSRAFGRSLELAADGLDRMKTLGAMIVAQGDPEYPKRLYEIYDPPLILHVRGNLEVIHN
jgi:DNA processing protein